MYFWSILHKSFRMQALYLVEFLVTNLQFFIQGIVTILVGFYTNAAIGNYSELEIAQYYLFSVGFLLYFTRNYIVKEFESEIISGNFITKLVRPYNFLIFILVRNFTKVLPKATFSFLVYSILITALIQFPLTLTLIFRGFIGIAFALLFIYLIAAIFCQLALLLERIDDLFRIFTMLAFFGGGGFIPLTFLPTFMNYLPTSFIYFHPIQFITTGQLTAVCLALSYIGILLITNMLLFRKIQKHIEVNA